MPPRYMSLIVHVFLVFIFLPCLYESVPQWLILLHWAGNQLKFAWPVVPDPVSSEF